MIGSIQIIYYGGGPPPSPGVHTNHNEAGPQQNKISGRCGRCGVGGAVCDAGLPRVLQPGPGQPNVGGVGVELPEPPDPQAVDAVPDAGRGWVDVLLAGVSVLLHLGLPLLPLVEEPGVVLCVTIGQRLGVGQCRGPRVICSQLLQGSECANPCVVQILDRVDLSLGPSSFCDRFPEAGKLGESVSWSNVHSD